MTEPAPLLTAREAAAYLNVHRNTIQRLAKRGELPVFRISERGDMRFSQDELDAWLEKRR